MEFLCLETRGIFMKCARDIQAIKTNCLVILEYTQNTVCHLHQYWQLPSTVWLAGMISCGLLKRATHTEITLRMAGALIYIGWWKNEICSLLSIMGPVIGTILNKYQQSWDRESVLNKRWKSKLKSLASKLFSTTRYLLNNHLYSLD